jgi:hypothetical protein
LELGHMQQDIWRLFLVYSSYMKGRVIMVEKVLAARILWAGETRSFLDLGLPVLVVPSSRKVAQFDTQSLIKPRSII